MLGLEAGSLLISLLFFAGYILIGVMSLTFVLVLTVSVAGGFGCLFGTTWVVRVIMVSVAGVCGCFSGVLRARGGGLGI